MEQNKRKWDAMINEFFDNLPESLEKYGSVDSSVKDFNTLNEALEDLHKRILKENLENKINPDSPFRRLKYIG